MSNSPGSVTLTPIGIYYSEAKAPYEAARQPLERVTTHGEVILQSGQMFEQALEDLQGFDRVWLIYLFHHNPNWKPKVMPPRGTDRKVGVFSTRAPYRPNPIGISCVKLGKVQSLKLEVTGADLLDGTPILDIKPYLPYADSFPDSATGWLGEPELYTVSFSELSLRQIEFLAPHGIASLRDFILNQLEYDPINSDKKRVTIQDNSGVLAYKTWRVQFEFNAHAKAVSITKIFSGYEAKELTDSEDRYQDKAIHRLYSETFFKPE